MDVMTILNNTDLYAAVRSLSDELRVAGEQRWRAALDDALSISSVPGEILGETRLQLQRLRASQVAIPLKWRVDEALSYLDEILGSS